MMMRSRRLVSSPKPPARLLRPALAIIVTLMALPVDRAGAHAYPTEVIGDYLFACMASNGQTPEALQRCACSIDVIASIMPHEDYVKAETYASMRQVRGGGEKMALFRETEAAKVTMQQLKRAQIEAELRCF